MQAILGFSGIVLENLKEDTPNRRHIEEIQKAGKRAAELTRQLMSFSRKQAIQRSKLDINASIRNTEVLLHVLLGDKIKLDFDLCDTLVPIFADHGQMIQIIMNIAVNARDAMSEGGRLTLATENITLHADDVDTLPGSRPGEFVCLSLTDTGCGMNQEVKDRLFEPFFTTKEVGKGTGLGLAVIYGIVQQNKGWIHVYSEEGMGTSFKIYLPAIPAGFEIETASSQGHSKRILLVENNEDLRDMAVRLLKTAGYNLVAVASADAALQRFEEDEGRFGILFSDIVLSGKDGIQLASELRGKNPTLPVLLCSGYSDRHQRWGEIQNKGYHFLQKPFTIASLLNAVHEALAEPV